MTLSLHKKNIWKITYMAHIEKTKMVITAKVKCPLGLLMSLCFSLLCDFPCLSFKGQWKTLLIKKGVLWMHFSLTRPTYDTKSQRTRTTDHYNCVRMGTNVQTSQDISMGIFLECNLFKDYSSWNSIKLLIK